MRREAMAGVVAAALLAGGAVGYVATRDSDDDPGSVVALDETPSPTPTVTPSPTPSAVLTTIAPPTLVPTTVAPTTTSPTPKPTPKRAVAHVVADNGSNETAKVSIDSMTFFLGSGDTRRIDVVPAANGNDVITVASREHPTCGRGDVFGLKAGRTYRLVIKTTPGCEVDGKPVTYPGFELLDA